MKQNLKKKSKQSLKKLKQNQKSNHLQKKSIKKMILKDLNIKQKKFLKIQAKLKI